VVGAFLVMLATVILVAWLVPIPCTDAVVV
jgi:hypothetical protein